MNDGLMDKPLPTLDEWIGPGPRCDSYYEYVATNLDMQRLADLTDQPDAAASLRMTMTLGIAMAEACRIETDTHGREPIEACVMMARCIGWAALGPLVSILKDDAPLRKIETMMLAEMKIGLHHFITSAIEQQRENSANAQATN